MKNACREFRARLVEALGASTAQTDELASLSWHQHLLGCPDCRALLDSEEALDALLSTLPAPVRPSALVGEVLAALRPHRDEEALERLLERVPAPTPPADLAARVLRGLEPRRGRTFRRPLTRSMMLAAAVLLALVWSAWMVRGRHAPGPSSLDEPSEALLASLELLESWEFLATDDLDLDLAALDEVDLLILALEAEDSR